jgi:two-component system, OmpR family, KDP operon response regulator KdpE
MKAVYIGNGRQIADVVNLALRLRWPETMLLIATTAREGLEMVEWESPDVVLLQPDFADLTLGEAIQGIRRFTDVVLLVLGQDEDGMEAVTSLEMGADAYVRRPCDVTEIMMRVQVLLRRIGSQILPESEGLMRCGDLCINPAAYEVFLGERRVTLTSTEVRLLHVLIKNRGTVVSCEKLERALWGDQEDNGRLVKKYVQRLRRKLGDDSRDPLWVAGVPRVGYRFIGPPPAGAPQPEEAALAV